MFDIFEDKIRKVDDKHIRNSFIEKLVGNNISHFNLDYNKKNIIYNELGLKGNVKNYRSKVEIISDLSIFQTVDDLNYTTYGFEIKSDKDNTNRLYKQMEMYYQYYDYVYIITTQSMLSEVSKVLFKLNKDNKKYDNIGLIIYDNYSDTFKIFRLANKINLNNGSRWSKLLWSNELVDALLECGEFNFSRDTGYYYKSDKKRRLDDLFSKSINENKSLMKDLKSLVVSFIYKRCQDKLNGVIKGRREWAKEVELLNNTMIVRSNNNKKVSLDKVNRHISYEDAVRILKFEYAEWLRKDLTINKDLEYSKFIKVRNNIYESLLTDLNQFKNKGGIYESDYLNIKLKYQFNIDEFNKIKLKLNL